MSQSAAVEGVVPPVDSRPGAAGVTETTPGPPANDGIQFIREILQTIVHTLRAALFVVVKTPYVLFPSAAHSSIKDKKYNEGLVKDYASLVEKLALSEPQKHLLVNTWLGQIDWTNDRSTKERDANELIRWWLIILAVLIPVFATTPGDSGKVLVSVLGVVVAILSAINQFRRPEERWRHYRITSERYQSELGRFFALSGPDYRALKAPEGYAEAFPIFHENMTRIRQDDLTAFFGEVVKRSNENQTQETTPGADPAIAVDPAV